MSQFDADSVHDIGGIKHIQTHPEAYFALTGPGLRACIVHPFPDETNKYEVYGNEGFQFSRIVAQKCTAEDADRIAACLNALKAYPTDVIEASTFTTRPNT